MLAKGKTGTFEWTAPAVPGKYNFQCDIHPQQMTGVVTVQ
jgi:plastocyanin